MLLKNMLTTGGQGFHGGRAACFCFCRNGGAGGGGAVAAAAVAAAAAVVAVVAVAVAVVPAVTSGSTEMSVLEVLASQWRQLVGIAASSSVSLMRRLDAVSCSEFR